MPANTYGRQVVEALVNKSGGGVIKGDTVVIDTTNNDAFTTSTAGAFTGLVGVAQETIASNATGRVLTAGYADLVNTSASVTRGNFGKTHTVAKQTVDAGSSRVAGTFCQFLTGGTTPDAHLFGLADNTSGAGTGTLTTVKDEGSNLSTAVASIDFVGAGVTATGTTAVTATIPGSTLVQLDEKIASGGATASLDFTSISGAYRHLELRMMLRGLVAATQAGLYLRFNNDSGANYSCSRMYGQGSGAASDSFDGQTSMQNICHLCGSTATASVFSSGTILVPHYANTGFHKMVEARSSGWTSTSGSTFVVSLANAGKWASTAAVSRITLFPSSGNFADGSIATLYGVS